MSDQSTPTPTAETTPTEQTLDALEADTAESNGEVEAPTFSLRDQTYTLETQLPAIVALRLSAAADPKTSIPKQMTAILQFLDHAVIEDDRERFYDYLENAKPMVDFEELSKVMEDATEAISGRPTESPSD